LKTKKEDEGSNGIENGEGSLAANKK